MPKMILCGEYILLEALKNVADNSNFKLPDTIKIHERFQNSKVVRVSSGLPSSQSEKIEKYNIFCKPGDTVVFRASSAEQIIDPFTQKEYLVLKNSDIIMIFEGE